MFFKQTLIALLLILLSQFSLEAQGKNRLIIVKCPKLVNTNTFKYSVSARSAEDRYDRLCTNGKYFCDYEVKNDFQEIEVVIPSYYKDSNVLIHFEIELVNGHWYYWDYPDTLVEMTSDTVCLDLQPINEKALKWKYTKKKFEDFWDWGILQSKIVTVSYYQGYKPYGEIMFSLSEVASIHDWNPAMFGPAIGTEFNFQWRNNFILGPKVGFYYSTFLFNVGLHAVTYTDFERTSLFLKPRIGINPLTAKFNISYAYGIPLTKNHFGKHVNTHQISLNFNIPLYID